VLVKSTGKGGFTLIEIILVVVISLVLLGVALPYFAHTYKGTKLRLAARTVNRMTRYARSMAIMREQTMTVVINHETMEIFLGSTEQASTHTTDGELDQDVLKRLGYVDDGEGSDRAGIEKEVRRFLPEQIDVTNFEKDSLEDEEKYKNLYLIHYYPDGQSDWFILELEDQRGLGVKLENDSISGKIRSEFMQ